MKRVSARWIRAFSSSNHSPIARSSNFCTSSPVERHVRQASLWGKWTPPPLFGSLLQPKFCRTCSTSSSPGLFKLGDLSEAIPSTEVKRDVSEENEVHSVALGQKTSLLEIPFADMAVESAFKSSSRHDMAMLFTCTICNVRSAKTMSRATYETGVVIVRCPGCQNLHLIADRYGWFGKAGSVEDFLAEKGVDVRVGSDSTYEFSVEDMVGWTPHSTSEK